MEKVGKKPQVLVVGNPLVPEDSLPLRLLPVLRKQFPEIEFLPFEPTRQEFPPAPQPILIIDSVMGVKEAKLITDLSIIESGGRYSLHDFDLGAQLLLLTKLGRIGPVKIIGVPMNGEEKEVGAQVSRLLRAEVGSCL